MLRSCICVLIPFVLAASASADDLAALAKKEKARRAQIAKPSQVYTEATAKETTGAVTTMVASESAPAAAPATTSTVPVEVQKAEWKAKALAARQAAQAAQDAVAAAEVQLADFESDQAARTPEELLDPMRLQNRQAKAKEMRAQLENQRTIAKDLKKAVDLLEEAARKQGIPPGWLR